jgi:hypothetical protein
LGADQPGSRFVTDFYLLVLDWAPWAAAGIAETWPHDPRQGAHDPEVIAETVERARKGLVLGRGEDGDRFAAGAGALEGDPQGGADSQVGGVGVDELGPPPGAFG